MPRVPTRAQTRRSRRSCASPSDGACGPEPRDHAASRACTGAHRPRPLLHRSRPSLHRSRHRNIGRDHRNVVRDHRYIVRGHRYIVRGHRNVVTTREAGSTRVATALPRDPSNELTPYARVRDPSRNTRTSQRRAMLFREARRKTARRHPTPRSADRSRPTAHVGAVGKTRDVTQRHDPRIDRGADSPRGRSSDKRCARALDDVRAHCFEREALPVVGCHRNIGRDPRYIVRGHRNVVTTRKPA